jgi:hypothetical protein
MGCGKMHHCLSGDIHILFVLFHYGFSFSRVTSVPLAEPNAGPVDYHALDIIESKEPSAPAAKTHMQLPVKDVLRLNAIP